MIRRGGSLVDEERAKVVFQLVLRVVIAPREDGRVKVSATGRACPFCIKRECVGTSGGSRRSRPESM
jgi:hypothetical protein